MNLPQSNAVKHLLAAVLVMFTSVAFAADIDYDLGHGALQIFNGDAAPFTPTWVKVWLGFLISTFAAGIYFAWKHPVARLAVAGFLVSMGTGELVFSLLGLPFLGGAIAIMHIICWSPALLALLIRRPFLDFTEPKSFRIWSGVMTGVIIFSFVFDVRDAFIYISHISSLV